MKNLSKTLIALLLLIIMIFTSSCQNPKNNTPGNDSSKDLDPGPDQPQLGSITTFAKGFEGADGIAIDYDGNMYVGGRGNNMIYKVTSRGEVSDFVSLQCAELLCMTTDKDNNLYAAGRDKVFKISPQAAVTVLASDFTCADDLRLDLQGNVYVTDSYENRVYRITPQLEKSIFIESDITQDELESGWHVTGIAFDKDCKNLYIARMLRGDIVKYPINDNGSAGPPEVVASDLPEPDHLDMDQEGNLYATLFRVGSLIKIDPAGNITKICDGKMGYATGVILGRDDFDLNFAYVADYKRNVVHKINIAPDKQ